MYYKFHASVCLCVYTFMCVYLCTLMYAHSNHIVGSLGCRSVLPARSDHALSRLITISTIATPVIRHGTVPCYIQIACVITSCSDCSHLPSHSTSLTISSHYILHLTILEHSICKLLECRRLQYSCILVC